MVSNFRIGDRARHHLILSDRQGWSTAKRLLQELAANGASRQYLRHTERCTDAQLAARIAQQVMGTHLYVAGAAPWVANVVRIAQGEGMLPSEVDAIRIGPPASQVFCIACHERFPHPQQETACCPHCGAALSVTNHVSDRLDAVMGSLRLTQVEGGRADG